MAKAPAAPTGRALAPTQPSALAISRLDFLSEHAGKGTENVGMNDIIMPRIGILQALSPQVNKRKAEYVEGAEPGLIINVATLQVTDKLRVVPCKYIRHHIEWRPNRGGFVADHGEDESIMKRVKHRDDKHFDILDNGNIIMPTPTWYCLDLDNDLAQCIIPMPRTQSKTSKSWMSQVTSEKIDHPQHGKFPAPIWFRAWDLTTAEREDGENSWFVWNATRGPSVVDTVPNKDPKGEPELVLPANTMQAAIRFQQLLDSGEIRASAESFDDGSEGRGDSGGNGGKETF